MTIACRKMSHCCMFVLMQVLGHVSVVSQRENINLFETNINSTGSIILVSFHHQYYSNMKKNGSLQPEDVRIVFMNVNSSTAARIVCQVR